jgi:hypothetical protein
LLYNNSETKVKIADYDLFYLLLKGGTAAKAEDYKIVCTYTDALDRFGHSTKLYIGSRPEPAPTETRRPGL